MNSPTNSRISSAITKLVFAITLTLTLLYSVFVLGYSWVIEDNIFNRLVAQQVSIIKNKYLTTGEIGVSSSQIFELFKGWEHIPPEIRSSFEQEPNRVEFSLANGKTYHLARFYLDKEEYVLLADVEGFEVSRDYLSNTLTWLVVFSFVSCALVAFLGWRMGRKIAKPIEDLAVKVKRLDAGDTSSLMPLTVQMPNNEIKALAHAIEQSFTQLNEALTREVHFTKDISHEIRTPISVLQNALSQGVNASVKANYDGNSICFSTQAVKQMRSAADKLTQTTHVLLALARNESSITEEVSLNQVIEQCVLNHFGLNHTSKGKQLELDVKMPSDDVVKSINRNLLEILVNNLLSNVVAHASGKTVELLLNNTSMRITNEFNGVLPENIQSSGIKAEVSEGIGQGLSLIERICDVVGWKVNVELDKELKLFRVLIIYA